MADKPIIFSAPMIRVLLDGRKTQTRRVLKPQPSPHVQILKVGRFWDWRDGTRGGSVRVPYAIGDRLWVRESFVTGFDIDDEIGQPVGDIKVWYRATDVGLSWYNPDTESTFDNPPWRSPIHMPRALSRMTLAVTHVRVARLQDISEEDADAEGFGGDFPHVVMPHVFPSADKASVLTIVECFARLWNSIHGPDAWDANPWVVALTFDVIQANIDQVK